MWLQALYICLVNLAEAQVNPGELPDQSGQLPTQTIMTLFTANLPIILSVVAIAAVFLLIILLRGSN